MAKTANLYVRIEPELKKQADLILDTLGISASSAINLFYKQIVLNNGLPFEVKLPNPLLTDITTLSNDQLNEEIKKGIMDIEQGRTKEAKTVFQDIHNKCNL